MDTIGILDFGGQYCHLIARRIRDLGVFAEVLPAETTMQTLQNIENLRGIILSGGAASVYDSSSPKIEKELLSINIPILGICYGHQLIAHADGGIVISGEAGEYGSTEVTLQKSVLFDGLEENELMWMNHRDLVERIPVSYIATASTKHSSIAAFENTEKKLYGVQFHPEVSHSLHGLRILENFVLNICHAKQEWKVSDMITRITTEIEKELRGKKAIIGLSGGIDSSTAAVLVRKVLKDNLVAVYVDTGLMRLNEMEFMERAFSNSNLRIVHAQEKFFEALKNIVDPEEKRKIIGGLFIEIFDQAALEEQAEVLVQGTIYSDRIESGITKHSSTIKSHHNVGGLPKEMKLQVYEPLRDLYKDEVRSIAKDLGIASEIIYCHVFPGPGQAIRIVGEVTQEKAEIVRRASFIVEDELKKAGYYDQVWMSFAVLLSIKSVGIQGDERSYKYPMVVRIVESKDAMTASFSRVPYDVLERISSRITNELPQVNRVVYDISNKPPATMEWE